MDRRLSVLPARGLGQLWTACCPSRLPGGWGSCGPPAVRPAFPRAGAAMDRRLSVLPSRGLRQLWTAGCPSRLPEGWGSCRAELSVCLSVCVCVCPPGDGREPTAPVDCRAAASFPARSTLNSPCWTDGRLAAREGDGRGDGRGREGRLTYRPLTGRGTDQNGGGGGGTEPPGLEGLPGVVITAG